MTLFKYSARWGSKIPVDNHFAYGCIIYNGAYNLVYKQVQGKAMKRLKLGYGVLTLTLLFAPLSVLAAPKILSPLLISEIQTGSKTSASEEFIELTNVSEAPIDLSSWHLEYFSASTTPLTTPFRTIVLHGAIEPGGFHLTTSTNYLNNLATDHFSPTLAQAGGHVRLVSVDQSKVATVRDTVGWGTAVSPETSAALAPGGGSSLMRLAGADGVLADSNNNKTDFALSTGPTPGALNTLKVPEKSPQPSGDTPAPENNPGSPVPATDPPVESPEVPQPSVEPTAPLEITELLPNPGAPGTDANNEFTELYNPTDAEVILAGYKLETGNTNSYAYTFKNEHIAAHNYLVLTSAQTKLVLANAGSKARLLGPDGSVVSETIAYGEAKQDQAWAKINDVWQWTITPTPGAANILNIAQVLSKQTALKKVAAAKKSTAKSAAKTKTVAKKTAAKKTAKKAPKSVASTAKSSESGSGGDGQIASVHPLVLAGVGGVALLYAAYEYRQDVINFIHRLRTNRAARRAHGS
ncbi:MAG: Non specific extracellular endonuclease cleaving [Candidatus Saccharibacteria bacterium]|nr:Non specific extracellular endonuclease cleaving [Candidatus Saccharibacteria bacterium]